MFIILTLFSIYSSVTSRILFETINSTNTLQETSEQHLRFNTSYISVHRLIFAKFILLLLLGCFFWICLCQLIIRQICMDKQRSKSSINTQENISTISIEYT